MREELAAAAVAPSCHRGKRASGEGGGCAKFPDAASSAAQQWKGEGGGGREGGREVDTESTSRKRARLSARIAEEYKLDRSRIEELPKT